MARSSLGKKRRKGDERFKATPEKFPDEGPVEISAAYDVLSRRAFAVWLRLAVASREDLHGGRGHLAQLLGYSQRRCNEVLLELERNGYVSFVPNGPWQPTTVVIERTPGIRRGSRFVRFSYALLSDSKNGFEVTTWAVSTDAKPLVSKRQSHTYPNRSHTFQHRSFTCLPASEERKDICDRRGRK